MAEREGQNILMGMRYAKIIKPTVIFFFKYFVGGGQNFSSVELEATPAHFPSYDYI